MNEEEWVKKYLSNKTRSWENLKVSLDDCPEPLKSRLQEFRKFQSDYHRMLGELDKRFIALGYDAG